MSIEAMKQALDVIEAAIESGDWQVDGACDPSMAIHSLYEAIAEAEKQEPSLWFAIAKDGRVKYTTDSDRAIKWKQSDSYRLVRDYYAAPVHARQEWAMQQMVDENQRLGLYVKEKNCPSAD